MIRTWFHILLKAYFLCIFKSEVVGEYQFLPLGGTGVFVMGETFCVIFLFLSFFFLLKDDQLPSSGDVSAHVL